MVEGPPRDIPAEMERMAATGTNYLWARSMLRGAARIRRLEAFVRTIDSDEARAALEEPE